MAERPLYTLYKNLKAQNYDVPDDYNKFESALTRDGKGGADNRHAIYENLKAQNFDVPSTYERFYSALFEPRSKTSSRAKGGSVPMSAADRARFSAGAAAISASAQQTMNNAGRYNRLKQRKQKQQKDFGRVNLGTHQTPYGGDANNVVKDDFAYNPETGKTGAYVTSDNENVYSLPEAEQKQAILDQQNNAYQVAVDTGEIPSAFDVRDKKGNYDLQENIGKNGTYLTEEGAQKQFDKKLADAYARKKEIETLIAEDNRQHGNPLLSYGASIGASNGRTAEQSDYRNKLATSLSLVTEQIGALEAVKQYPTSSWGEDALKALDNTAFTAKTWDFGLTDFAIMGQMERIKTKMDNNIPLSGSDKMLLKSKLGADAATALEDEKMGNVYRWTKIAGQSLPFMADFFLTGGYGGITKGISRGALKFAAKRGMGKVGAAILKNTGIVAGDVIGSYAMAGTEQALKTGADIMQRHLGNLYQDEKGDYKFGTFDENGNLLHEGGESIGTALYKGMTSAMVENYTEKLFGHNYGIKNGAVNFMEKHGMNASAEFFKNIGKSGWYTNSKKWMEKFGINGFAEEVMEEEIGIPLHALLDGEGKVSDLLDAKQQLDIIGGMAISVGSMYAMGAGSRPVKGIYNRAQYYRFRNKVNVADSDAQNLMGDNWADIKDKIDNATNEQMGGVLSDILRQRDTMTKEQINAAVNYGVNLMKMRGYNIAKTAEMNAKEITNEPTTPEEQHQTDIDNAYSEGHDADDVDKHDIQIQQEDQMKTLAAALGISEQQLSAMSDDELQSLTGQDDKLDQAIYDYQLSSARYQGVVDDAQDKVDLAAHQAEQKVDMYTDQSRGSVRNATIKASGGLEDYGVYIISGNVATHDDGSIDVSNSDDMILYFDPTTNSVEHADAVMFAELGEELPAADVKAQAVSDAKENAIKEVAGIIDGIVEVGSQFNVTDTDGTEHTYEVLADYGDGTAAISIDGNVVENPYSLADLQQMKDLEDQKRLEAAKAEREQMENERAEQQTQETEETQPSFDFNQILNDNGNVVLVDVLDKDGNTKYPDSKLFLIRDAGAKAKVVELKNDGTIVPHAVNKEDVATISSMSLDEYKQAMPESSMIEDNSGENRGEIEVETPTIDGETAAPAEETPATEQTPVAPAITLEDGTIVPMLEDGNPDFSKLTAEQTAELYDSQFGEDADSIVSGYVSDAKKALDKASNMTVKGKTFVEQKAAKDAKEKAIADAQAAYDSAIAIRDAYNERQLAKVEDTAEGRKELIEKAAYAEQHKAEPEAELQAKSDEKAELKAKSEAKLDNESDNESNDLSNETDNEQKNDNINDNINVPEDATDEAPLGAQRDESDLPFSAKENGKQQTTAERAADVEKNKVDDMKVVDNIVGQKTRKTLEKLAKMMGANVQWQYSDKNANGWFDDKTNTIYLTLDSSITEGVQFIFGHEMTHEMRTKNPAAYDELKTLVKDMMGEDAFNSETDRITSLYNENNVFYNGGRTAYEEEVVADQLGKWIRDANYAHTLLLKMSHPLLAKLHEIVNRFLMALHGIEISDDMNLILRFIEQAYVKTAKGEVTNSETGEDVSFSLRQKPEPKKKGIGYKVFVLKDGKLYPPMVANPDGAATPVGVWLDADAAPIAGESKTGRPQVKQGGKGTQGGSGKLAYRPGWHLGVVPYAIQFNRKDADGNKTLFPKNFVFAEVEYAADVDYQEEARQEGINPSGKYQHSLAGLKHLPTDGYYMYRTNPNPETDPWVITGAMKVNRILTRAEQVELVKKAGREPQQIQEGDIVTDDVVNSINQEIADAPKFSLKVYHGSGADFTEFDFDHMGEGAGSQVFGWGGYVTSSKKIGKSYATLMDNDPSKAYYRIQRSNGTRFAKKYPTLESFLHGDKQIAKNDKFTEQEKIDYYNEMKKLAEPYHNLYEVDIPEDNGSNYLDWDKPLSKKQQDSIREGLEHLGVGIKTLESKGQSLERTGENIYNSTLYIGLTGTEYDLPERTKGISKFLSFVGFTGIKYKAGRNFGGAKRGDTNYVIFKPEDMKITQHTKFSLRLKSAIDETETNPSDAQKESGNYKKGHIKFGGYDYTIENLKGSTRSGKDADGKEWKVTMHDTYGYIRGKFGKDGDHLDMFINDKADLDNWNGDVFVVDQVNPDGSFDEHKVMYGYDSMDGAKKAYLANYSDGWQGLGNITGVSKDEFDKWLDTSKRKLKPFADYAKVKFSLKDNQGNPLNQDGTLKLDKIKSVDELTDEDFLHPTRNVELPSLPKKIADAIGTEGKPVVIKKNIFERNYMRHKDVTPELSKVIFKSALYNPDLYGQNQKKTRPYNWVLINTKDENGNNRTVLLEVNPNKDNVEIVHWHFVNDKNLGLIKKQAIREGDQVLILPSEQSEEVGGLSNLTDDLSAAKIDNSSETAKENGEKFSLKDEKTMFGMHNISVDKLRKAIKQGGFAAPSMGVVDSKNGIYSDYGEITLIPKAEKLAKRTGKNAGTFTADAWTPTYPQVERIMNKQGEKAFNTDMNVKLGDVDNGIYSNVRESWKGYLSSGDVRDGLYWHYLFDKGMNPETIYQTGKYDNDITNEVMRISDNGNKTDYTDKEVAELIQLMNKATGKDNDVDAQREKLKARIASAEKQGNHLLVALKKKRLEELEGVENFYIAADFVNDVVRNNRKNGKVDVHDTMDAAKEKVENDKKLSDDFPSWLDKKTEEYGVEEMLYNGTTPSGKPKYIPNTIDNAVKLMKKQGVAGGYTAFGSELGVFIAKNSPEVNTLAAMKNAKDKLIPFGDERHNQIKDKITKEFLELSDEIRVGSNNRYAFDDSGVSRMVELTDHKGNEREYLKKAYNVEVSDEWMNRYNKLLDTIKKDYKVFYFETKFMRPYGLDEFEKAIVPSDTPSDVVDALKKAGIDVSSYERGNAEDRQKVTMDAINSSDNIRFSLAGERGAAAADKAEERTFRMDNLSVARKMEEEKKDAKAIKMATGWERGADGKWRYEMSDAKIKDTMDVGGGHIVKRYEDDMLWNGGKLSKVIDAPELFKAYPQLKDVRIETDAIMNDMPSNGEYNSKTNTITIHADELKYMNGILNHEIQHAIQDIEGFAKGGSPRLVRGEVKKRFDEVTKQIKQLRAEGKEDEAKALIEKNRSLYNAYMKNDDFDSYKSLAGEVEARNVSARLNMTPEERRKTLAESTEDVARKDQIFLGVGDVSFSLHDMADGKESGSADMAEDLKSLNTPDEVDDAIKTAIDNMPSGWKMANRKMIHIAQALGENRKAEIAGEEPKFSLKDVTLIKAGTYFSGGGLVEEGLKGIIDPVVAVEYDEKISGVYRNNFGQHIVTADVRDVDPKELVKQIDGEVEYFHASPVCKNYSQAKSNHAEVELDKETAASTAEFINAVKPRVVTIENVKGYKDSDAMKIITDALDANGYTWDADVYNAADYGGYTNRERLIVRAVRDGKLPAKPEKMARKSGWYEAVADIIPTLTEKKNGVAPWMDIRLKADGIDWRNIDKPLYVMGSAYADGKVPHAFADELLPTLRTKSGDVIVMPDGKVYRAMGRVLARVSGVSDDYKMPFSENLSHIIIGNGIPTQLTEHVIAPLLQNTLRPTTTDDGNTKFSLRYDQFEHDLNQWKKDNNLPKDAKRPTIPQRNAGESAVDFLRRVDEYRKQMALWKTAPTYEQHLLSDDTALGEFNRELQKGSVLKRIAFQDSMLAIRKAQEAIMKEVGVDLLNMAEDAYTAENRSHGKGKNEFEEYNNEFLQPLRKAYHQMKKILGDSYDNVRIYMMAKHGLERDAQMAFKKSLDADYEDVAQRSAAYKAYKGDMNRIINDSDLEFGRVDFTTWRQRDNALRAKYSPSYMNYRYDKNGIAYDYSGLSALFDGSDFEEAAYKLVKDIEDKYVTETHNLWDATNAATKKILRDGYKAGMMSKDTYQYVRDMYSHYIPLRGWDGTTADQVWDYIGGGKGAFNQTLKKAHGRTSIADDPIAYIENMAESGILLNNKNWVKQHLMLLAQNHPTSLLTLSKAWYVKSTDANGNEEWIPATPQITSQMDSNQVKAAIDAFEKKMEQMAQAGDATQKRDGLNIAYPQTHSEEREHEVRVMKDGEEYVIYVNGDPQLAQAMNNTRAHRVREIQSGKLDRAAAWLGRKMAAAYTSLSPLFIPSNYFRDLTMTLASTAIREDAKYNYLLRKNLATSWNLGFMLRDYQNGKLRDKVNNGNATPKEQMFYDFMMNGGETGFVSSLDVEDLKKKFKNDLKDLDRWKANPVKVGHTIMDGIEFLNRAIEDSNRFAIYMTSIQYGRSIDEAVNDAKDVTLNFNRKGTGEHSWQTIRNLYLFINPAVQSLQTLGALAKHHPFKFTAVTASWLASGVLVPIVNVALMQLGAAFLGGDGDDDKDWYKDISKKYWQFSKWDRRNNFIMWVPTTHEFVKIPLAQEFRAFYGLGDMIASKMMGGELAEESWEDYGWDLVGQVVDMLPLDPTGYDGNIAVSLMPNAIRPVFELAFNVDFTGKPLFKDTEYNKYDPNFTKAYVGTPDWLVRASRMMNSIGNDYPNVQQNKWDALGNPRYNLNNPAVVDHVLSSYLGGAYTMGSQVLGLLTKSLNDRKEIKVADIPLFSKFVSNPDDRPVTKKQGDEFWNMKENHDRAANTLSKLKKQAKVDGDYSMLERFYGSEEYKKYKQDDVKVKKYEEDKKKERAEESGEEYRPHKLNAEDIYKAHATPKDDFEDLKLKQLYTKLNGFKTSYDLLVDTAPSQSDGYYNNNKAAIDAIDEISLDKQEISELKKGFLDDGKDAYNAEDMKQIRDLRKKILSVLEKANKVVVANQKAKAKK